MSKKTVVVKIGTSSLTEKSGRLDVNRLRALTGQIASLRDAGNQVILVTSAAIAAGYSLLGYQERPVSVPAKQASAAVGQGLLMEEYTRCLHERGYVAAQILLTRADFSDRRRYHNAFSALEVLLAPDELYIHGGIADFNNSSVITLLYDGQDSILFLGDAMQEATNRLTAMYGDTLKANQVQVAHHGVGNSSAAFYQSLEPSTLWYPCGARLYDWTVEFADNIRRNGAVRQELHESGLYEILLHDATAWLRVWGSRSPAQAFDAS